MGPVQGSADARDFALMRWHVVNLWIPAPHPDRTSSRPPLRSPLTKHAILFLAANPLCTDRLALDQEARDTRRSAEVSDMTCPVPLRAHRLRIGIA